MTGWVKLHRDLMDHWVSDEPESLAVFIRLICEANFADNRKQLNGRPVNIKRGQLVFSYDKFAGRSGVSVSKLRRIIKRLYEDGTIDKQSYSKYSVISVVNYESYQGDGKQDASRTQADNKQNATLEEGKNSTREEKPSSASSDAHMDEAFEVFWKAGMRKSGKQPARQKFAKAAKAHGDPMEFAQMLAEDVALRNQAGILGFDKMLPSTYLHQRRWEDEKPDVCPHRQIVRAWNEVMPDHIHKVSEEDWVPGVSGYSTLQDAWAHFKTKPRQSTGKPVYETMERGIDFYRTVFSKLAKSGKMEDPRAHSWCRISWAVKPDVTVSIMRDEQN